MSKHTPAPWFVTGNMTLYVEARIGGGLLQEVAAVGPTEADSGYGPQQRANADLIAAAPDLLKALEKVIADVPGDGFDDWHGMALDAIAKARGQ